MKRKTEEITFIHRLDFRNLVFNVFKEYRHKELEPDTLTNILYNEIILWLLENGYNALILDGFELKPTNIKQ